MDEVKYPIFPEAPDEQGRRTAKLIEKGLGGTLTMFLSTFCALDFFAASLLLSSECSILARHAPPFRTLPVAAISFVDRS